MINAWDYSYNSDVEIDSLIIVCVGNFMNQHCCYTLHASYTGELAYCFSRVRLCSKSD